MGYLEIACAGVIWAATGPILKNLMKVGFTSWDIVLGRALFSLTFLGLWLLLQRQKARRAAAAPDDAAEAAMGPLVPTMQDIPTFMAIGFLAVVLSQTTYFYSLSQTSVAVAVTLNYTAPFFVMLIAYFAYKEPMTAQKAVALAGAIAGVALVSGFIGPSSGRLNMSVPGVVAGLASGLAYGCQTVVYKRVGRRYGPIPLIFWTMTFGAAELSVILMAITRQLPEIVFKVAAATPHTLLLLILIGLGPGASAFVLFVDGINKVEATRGSIVAMSEPVAACLLGYLILGETLTFLQILGVVLVLASIWTVSVPRTAFSRRAKPAASRDTEA